jgi:hypothetical protein
MTVSLMAAFLMTVSLMAAHLMAAHLMPDAFATLSLTFATRVLGGGVCEVHRLPETHT